MVPVYSVRNNPRRRRIGTTSSMNTSIPPGSHGGITLKPSAAPDSAHSWIVSATWSGVPVTTRWPRAPASRWHSWRSVGFSRSTMSSTSWKRLPSLRSLVGVDDLARERLVEVVRRQVDAGQPVELGERVPRLGEVVELLVQVLGLLRRGPDERADAREHLEPAGVAALRLRAALDVGVELLRRPERLVRGEDRLGPAGGEGPPVLRRPGLHVDRPALRATAAR